MFDVLFVVFIFYMLSKAALSIYMLSFIGNTGIASISEAFKTIEACIRNKNLDYGISERSLKMMGFFYKLNRIVGWGFVCLVILLLAMVVKVAIE